MTFRLDRMTNVKLTAEQREGEKLFKELGMSGFTKRVFNMFRGVSEHVGMNMSNIRNAAEEFVLREVVYA